jgi:hypothetical protein
MSLLHEHIGLTPTVSVTHLQDQSEESFIGNVSVACRLLRSMRLRCSLFAIYPLGMSARSAAARLTNRFGIYGLVGILPRGRVGFLHLDRCLISEKGDEAVTAFVRGQAAEALGAGRTKHIAAFHYWTDETTEPEDIFQQLDGRTFDPDVAKPKAYSAGAC